jgi:hypothetical protein
LILHISSATYARNINDDAHRHVPVSSRAPLRNIGEVRLAELHLPRYCSDMSSIGHSGMWRWSRKAAGLPM